MLLNKIIVLILLAGLGAVYTSQNGSAPKAAVPSDNKTKAAIGDYSHEELVNIRHKVFHQIDQFPLWAYARDSYPTPKDSFKPQGNPRFIIKKGEDPDEITKFLTIEGSSGHFSRIQIRDSHNVISWFPEDHPQMPNIVRHGPKSLKKVRGWACGSCHLPNGAGRPENSPLAGLPVEYILQQLEDFRAVRRISADPRKPNTATMIRLAKAMSDQEMRDVAIYFSAIKQTDIVDVIETDRIPIVKLKRGVMHLLTGSEETEPLADRIVEVPTDEYQANYLRNSRARWTAYVPIGSVEKGKNLVQTGAAGKTIPCASCHGADLTGMASVPSIAGRSPSYMMRQLYEFKVETRNGALASAMKPVVANLDTQDMQAIVAYLASLSP